MEIRQTVISSAPRFTPSLHHVHWVDDPVISLDETFDNFRAGHMARAPFVLPLDNFTSLLPPPPGHGYFVRRPSIPVFPPFLRRRAAPLGRSFVRAFTAEARARRADGRVVTLRTLDTTFMTSIARSGDPASFQRILCAQIVSRATG